LGENLPLASGGGYAVIGVGYPLGERTRMFTGLSAGFYESIGLAQQVSVRLTNHLDLDLNARGGFVGSILEGGVSAGLRLHLSVY